MIVMISGLMQYFIGLSLEYYASIGNTASIVNTFTEQQFKLAFLIMPIGLILAFILSFFLQESYNLKEIEE